jgi:hypothetical protein
MSRQKQPKGPDFMAFPVQPSPPPARRGLTDPRSSGATPSKGRDAPLNDSRSTRSRAG